MSDIIVKSIEIRAPVSRVWQALTDHREFGTWFRVKLEGPFVPGKLARGPIALTVPSRPCSRSSNVVIKAASSRFMRRRASSGVSTQTRLDCVPVSGTVVSGPGSR